MKKNNKLAIIFTVVFVFLCFFCLWAFFILNKNETGEIEAIQNENNESIVDNTYKMTAEEIAELPTTKIEEQNEEQEKNLEQEVESEAFELQGKIAYEGDRAKTWNITLGDYIGLTYYNQGDSRWASKMYSSINDRTQTMKTSGCGPTSAAMIVTAIKGAITPDKMADLFVSHGYRSANSGTYGSAFRAVADEFNITYQETTNVNTAINLLNNNNFIIASCGNGLFTTDGHFIVLIGVENNNIKIYDPYLYSGKFDTSTRRGKAIVNGNTVYVSINNFKKYANAQGFFCYGYTGSVPRNNSKTVITNAYTRYVKVNTSLNVRKSPNGRIVGSLYNGNMVTIYETNGNWSRIGENRWVCSLYLYSNFPIASQQVSKPVSISNSYTIGTYKVKASILNVRTGAGTNYRAKKYYELSSNAKYQNRKLGNYYANGYKKGVVCTVKKINGFWGLTSSGWICLKYCNKL